VTYKGAKTAHECQCRITWQMVTSLWFKAFCDWKNN